MSEKTITVFNACPDDITISANGNKQIPVKAATDSWAPGTYPEAGATLTFSGNTNKSDGTLGQTTNNMRINIDGSSGGEINFKVTLPDDGEIKSRDALQMYVFWNSQNQVSWIFLNEGKPVAGAIVI